MQWNGHEKNAARAEHLPPPFKNPKRIGSMLEYVVTDYELLGIGVDGIEGESIVDDIGIDNPRRVELRERTRGDLTRAPIDVPDVCTGRERQGQMHRADLEAIAGQVPVCILPTQPVDHRSAQPHCHAFREESAGENERSALAELQCGGVEESEHGWSGFAG
jgi:hypothetical protein